MLNSVAPYGYLLPNLYLPVADIANPDFFVCGSRTWINRDNRTSNKVITSVC